MKKNILILVVAIIWIAFLLQFSGLTEIITPDYLNPGSPNYMKVTLIGGNASSPIYNFQFHHQKLNATYEKNLTGSTGLTSFLTIWVTSGLITQYQVSAAWKQILAQPGVADETIIQPVVNDTIITPIGDDGGGYIPDDAPDQEPKTLDYMPIIACTGIGVSFIVSAAGLINIPQFPKKWALMIGLISLSIAFAFYSGVI